MDADGTSLPLSMAAVPIGNASGCESRALIVMPSIAQSGDGK